MHFIFAARFCRVLLARPTPIGIGIKTQQDGNFVRTLAEKEFKKSDAAPSYSMPRRRWRQRILEFQENSFGFRLYIKTADLTRPYY